MLPVLLVMTLTFSRFLAAVMLPSRQGGDLFAGTWQLIAQVGRVSKTRSGTAKQRSARRARSPLALPRSGTLATRIVLAPPRDPEFKGMTERNNGFLETSFLPGRSFASPADFNVQLSESLPRERAHDPLARRPARRCPRS